MLCLMCLLLVSSYKNDSIETISNALIIDEDVRYNKSVEKLSQNYYCDIFKYDKTFTLI